MPSIRCEVRGDRLVVSADGEVEVTTSTYATRTRLWPSGPTGSRRGTTAARVRVFGPSWCSWYAYWGKVTERDVMDEVRQFDEQDLSVDLVLLDEGYQTEIGDWLTPRDDFGSTVRLAADIRSGGRRAGIWVAPFLVGSKSETARRHPEWLVPGITAGTNWGQEQLVLDVTHPGAARHLQDVFTELCRQGYDHFKLDFLYAGAIEGRRHEQLDGIAAYRHGLRLLREAVGPNRILHGCGAPILPSLGLVDCMRISPDTDPLVDPPSRRHQPTRPARRPVHLGRPRVPARPLVGQRLRLPDRATRRPGLARSGRRISRTPRAADVQRPDRRPGPSGVSTAPGSC